MFSDGDGPCIICGCISLSGPTNFKDMKCKQCYRDEMLVDILNPETIHEEIPCSTDSQ